MLYTRKERETPLLHHVSKSKGAATSTSVSTTTPFSSSYATSPFLSNFLQCQQPKLELDTFCAHVLHVSCTTRSGTGSNEPIPIQIVHLAPYNEDVAVQHEPQEASTTTFHTPRRKIGLKKKLTPRKDVYTTPAGGTSIKALGDPSSPAANTRSKKQLLLE